MSLCSCVQRPLFLVTPVCPGLGLSMPLARLLPPVCNPKLKYYWSMIKAAASECSQYSVFTVFTPAHPAACNSGQSVHTGPWAAQMYPHHGVPSPVSGNLHIEDCLSSVFITIIPPTLLYVGKQNWLYRHSKIHDWLRCSFNWKIWLTLVLWWGNHNKWKF